MRKAKVVVPVVLALLIFCLLIYDATYGKVTEKSLLSMNTVVSLKIYGTSDETLIDKIANRLNSLDADVLSRFNENSQLAKLNKSKKTTNANLVKWIDTLCGISEETSGKYDISIGMVSDLWDFSGENGLPDSDLLKKAMSESGYEKIKIEDSSVCLLNDNFKIDLGSAGKGIALDEINQLLSDSKVSNAVISVGGSVLLYGNKEFTVGIRDPYGNSGKYIATLSLSNNCISTSGVYEQCFENGGVLYHHILDPQTGYPVNNGILSCTVISESGILSDALSTACFVLGIEKGTELANKYNCKVIFVDEQRKIHTDEDTCKLINITDDTYAFA